MSSSTTPIADVCSSLKETDKLLSYLEDAVKRHPQVFGWLNTKQRRVLASSTFSLFAEECGDNAEDIKRKVEETKGQASTLKAQFESIKKELPSVEDSLVLLLDKASRLDDFIES
ncbi:hypothetical protein K1719_016650 [Acacia pycnantha]|nr:hypothetical protein K1719_016650 [Acacia pycnantha]